MLRSDELALLESGVSLIIGTVSPDGAPDAARVFGLRGSGDGLRFLCDEAAETALANLRAGGPVALSGSHIVTFQTIQVKGHAVSVEPSTEEDEALFAGYIDTVAATIAAIQRVPEALARNLMPARVVAVTCTVEAVFDQTPGPTAGLQLAPR